MVHNFYRLIFGISGSLLNLFSHEEDGITIVVNQRIINNF
jgi:hypothetical protein